MVMKRSGTEIIAKHREQLKQLGVKSFLFIWFNSKRGSYMNSDVDLLVELNLHRGLFEFIEVKIYLEDILGCCC